MTADCLFCRLVAGELPARVVHETDSVLTFHDIDPKAPTHLLAIPKRHYRDVGAMVEADPGLAGEVLAAAHTAATLAGIHTSGYRLVFNTGADASQTVFHVHCHVLGGRRMTWPPG
ncbi:histidine triad nucleotide-binding protein [Goodfellowiella coeruleoviolacea]|uniref:Histidine triad (HIT) family protein n=1 Tax=Goodfellowiella coeruleoviolacea TaxID=334858 RepID=A0AAE3GD72_9PSEU|nr:histidine triad nucleotide-binding protein [Goodfellowiella coeruleoviolacea]MCP2165087.1 histidine triad (HIT) family protein [Goodfellowiella coeruleoviolacea]